MLKRTIALVISMVLILGLVPHSAAVENTPQTVQTPRKDMEAEIIKQICAYADSIDQPNADDTAAWVLATHGMTRGGKDLNLGADSALTAAILNSQVCQTALTETLPSLIIAMQQLDLEEIPYIHGYQEWGTEKSFYGYFVMLTHSATYDERDWVIPKITRFVNNGNDYDDSLIWMVGTTGSYMSLERINVTKTEVTYRVDFEIHDFFDFHTAQSSGFKKLISGIGANLFTEFYWQCNVSFELTVPNNCTHSYGSYRWTYEPEEGVMTSDTGGGYLENSAVADTFSNYLGTEGSFFSLDQPVRLYHDVPWVMEWNAVYPTNVTFAPMNYAYSYSYPTLTLSRGATLYFCQREYLKLDEDEMLELDRDNDTYAAMNYYGTVLSAYYKTDTKNMRTFRLENVCNPDGSNMVYVTVTMTDTGEVLADQIPMDDYRRRVPWEDSSVMISEECDWISGKDIYISYIGNGANTFKAKQFELRIWERGEGAENGDYFAPIVKNATCTASGGIGKICSACGLIEYEEIIPATGHSFGAWVEESEPTCIRAGRDSRKCATCGYSESREVTALGHDNVETRIEPSCTDEGYMILDCRRCGKSEIGSTLAPLGHTYESGKCIRCGHESEYFVDFVSTSVSLGGNIAMHFYAVLSENLLQDESAYIQFTYGNNTRTVPLSEGEISIKDGVTRYMYSCPITSKNMTDTITAQIYTANGPVGESQSDDVRAYSSWLAENIQDKELEELLHAMLNYGAAAQIQFNYKTDDLANSLLDEEDKILKYADLSEFEMNRSRKDDGIKNTAATMLLDSETVIRIYYVLTGDKTIEDYTFRIDGVEVEPQYQESRDRYYVELPNIGAHELDEMHVFTVGNEIFHYGPMSYVYDVLTYDPEGSSIYNMALALYNYSAAAENYIQ